MFRRLKEKKAENQRKEMWSEEKSKIVTLQNKLNRLGCFPSNGLDGFDYAVKFFNTIKDFLDEFGTFQNAPMEAKPAQEELNELILSFGKSGTAKFNRAPEGGRATLDNTYWGGIFGLFTKTARFWKEENADAQYRDFAKRWLQKPEPNNPKAVEAYESMSNPPAYLVIIEFQVKPSIKGAYDKMQTLCKALIDAD